MATRKMRKQKSRPRVKRTIRRRRSAVAGKILPPLDVRSSKQLQEFKKRIEKGPVTFIMVWAPWCPHCHTMMPHFDAASKSPMRTAQSIKVEDKMLPAVNEMLTGQINKSAKPFNVEGFPSIIAVDKKGNVVTNIEPIRNTATMTKVMAEAGPIAEEAGINKTEVNMIEANSVVKNNLKNVIKAPNASIKSNGPALANLGLEESGLVNGPKNIDVGEEELKGSIASLNAPKSVKNLNSIALKNAGINKVKEVKLNMAEATAPSGVNSFPNKNIKSNAPPASMKEVEKEAEAITSMAAPLAPSNSSIDMESEPISNQLTPEQKLSGGGSKGGSLYSAMARTTFTLAPAAALLATAAMVMKKSNRKFRNTRKTRKQLTKSRKNRKSYRRH
jgi:thiol-disulfide isomerase/thioredoxin